ncbi:MAG TPA: TetR family transcriptional regulator [Pseudolysinimonas sp.]
MAILEAARRQFASGGFTATTIRSVAAAAEVDPGLVVHFFRTKDALFVAALELPIDLPGELLAAMRGEPAEAAERLISTYFAIWENPATAAPLTAMFRSAATNDQAANMLREFLLARIGKSADLPRPAATVSLLFAQLLGIAVARYIVRIEPIASMELDQLARELTPLAEFVLARGDASAS